MKCLVSAAGYCQQMGQERDEEWARPGRTMGHKAPEIPAHDTVPRRALAVVEGLLDVLRDVLLDVELGHGLLCCWDISSLSCLPLLPRAVLLRRGCGRTDVNGLLLHVLAHIDRFDLCCSWDRLVWMRRGEGDGRGSSNGALPGGNVPSSFSFTSRFSSWLGTILAVFCGVSVVSSANLVLGLVGVVVVELRVVAGSRYLYAQKKDRRGRGCRGMAENE